jgi:hypothetical protein
MFRLARWVLDRFWLVLCLEIAALIAALLYQFVA